MEHLPKEWRAEDQWSALRSARDGISEDITSKSKACLKRSKRLKSDCGMSQWRPGSESETGSRSAKHSRIIYNGFKDAMF